MRRSNFFIKLLSIALFLVLVCYIGYTVYDGYTNEFRTSAVFEVTIEDTMPVSGFVARDEYVISGNGGNTAVLIREGEKVSNGQSVAANYSDSENLLIRDEISSLEARKLRIEQLQDGSALSSAENSVLQLRYAVSCGDIVSADDIISELEAVLFEKYDGMTREELSEELTAIESEIASLTAQLNSGASYIYASAGGTFSHVTDGYESISSADMTNLSVTKYNELFGGGAQDVSDAVGKVITGLSWQYAVLVDESAAEKIKAGETYDILFEDISSEPISMTAETVSYSDSGKRAVVFSTNKHLQEVAGVRELEGTIIFDSYDALRVSKSAVHTDSDGVTYVYILRILQARRIDVTIISEHEDYYLIEKDGSIPANAEIIVKAKDLYDGKVVQ